MDVPTVPAPNMTTFILEPDQNSIGLAEIESLSKKLIRVCSKLPACVKLTLIVKERVITLRSSKFNNLTFSSQTVEQVYSCG